MRYPGNDPENGPAYPQTFENGEWRCAGHEFREYTDCDHETGEEFTVTQCRHCGEYQPYRIVCSNKLTEGF
jgi:hypothetical protein